MQIYRDLAEKKTAMAVIGLGYVGLPVALAFAKKIRVIAFDQNEERINQLQQAVDSNKETDADSFFKTDILFTVNPDDLQAARFFLVAVPTPVDKHKLPDLSYLKKAVHTIGNYLKKGDYVVFESTVYPGCTEEECLPVLEKISGLQCGIDFKIGYSPERITRVIKPILFQA